MKFLFFVTVRLFDSFKCHLEGTLLLATFGIIYQQAQFYKILITKIICHCGGHCVVFLSKTLHSHSVSLHLGV